MFSPATLRFAVSFLVTVILSAGGFLAADGIDNDGDGYCEDVVCTDGSLPNDCDDTNPNIHPNAVDVPGDDIDDNCDGTVACFVDADDDTYGSTSSAEVTAYTATGGLSDTPGACGQSSSDGYADNNTDCLDSDGMINPGQPDLPGNDLDENCDGTVACFVDADDDTYGSTSSAEVTAYTATWGVSDTSDVCDSSSSDGYADNNTDCLDSDAMINPGQPDLPGNDFDENCDGTVACFVDADDDTYGVPPGEEASVHTATGGVSDTSDVCDSSSSDGYADTDTDCLDSDHTVYPGAPDTCGDGIDSDCDGIGGPTGDEDQDGCIWQQEDAAGTSDCADDSDIDLLDDFDEMESNCVFEAGETDPADPDSDNDDALDGEEVLFMGTDPLDSDSDDDGLTDLIEDPNHNGVIDPGDTDPMDADTDDDGLMEGDEDLDADGELDPGESDPRITDTDVDLLSDGLEMGRFLPIPAGVSDGWGLSYLGTAAGWVGDLDPVSTTDPLNPDSDRDLLLDGDEDADGDGARGVEETDPTKWDTDEDSFSDGLEVECGSNPLDPGSLPDCHLFVDGFESGTLDGWSSSTL